MASNFERVQPESRVVSAGCLHLEVGPELETCLVRVRGELDLTGAAAFDRELSRLLAGDLQTVIVDLGELEFIDSTGIQSLVRIAQASRESGDKVRFLPGDGQVERVLSMTGAGAVLPYVA